MSYAEDSPPLDELEEIQIELENNINFTVFTNLAGFLDAAVMNWLARTTDHTAESFAKYIKSKRDKGYSDHWVLTEQQYAKELLEQKTKKQ